MTHVYVLQDKNGPTIFASPVALVRFQIDAAYQYEDDANLLTRARNIVETGDQREAWRLLEERNAWEYEGVRREQVID